MTVCYCQTDYLLLLDWFTCHWQSSKCKCAIFRLGSGKPQNLIIDDGKESDEDETFVVEEPAAPPIDQEQVTLEFG